MKVLLQIAAVVLLCHVSHAGQLNLPKDTAGWTIFTPSADTDVVYVDTVSGNDTTCISYRTSSETMGPDPFNPAGTVIPCATMATAISKTATGDPDWILIKRGSVFNVTFGSIRSGKSESEPAVIAAYGLGDMPVFKPPSVYDSQVFGRTTSSLDTQYFAISGISFYASVRDPASPDYVNGTNFQGLWWYAGPGRVMHSVLIEGCSFRFFKDNAIQAYDKGAISDFTLRRNTFLNNYSGSTAHSQGLFLMYVRDFIIEENIFDHNGWLNVSDNTEPVVAGEATPYNHNLYVTLSDNLAIRNNIFARPSSNSIKESNSAPPEPDAITVGFVAENNLFIDGDIAISIGASDQHLQHGHYNPQVFNNVFHSPGMSNITGREIAWVFYNWNVDSGDFYNNLMIHQTDATLDTKFLSNGFSHRGNSYRNNVIWNVKNADFFQIYADSDNSFTPTGELTGNKISIDSTGKYIVDAETLASISGVTFTGNQYHMTKTADTWFYLNADIKTNAEWAAGTGDTSRFEQATFPDTTRSVETYMTSIGETATLDAFIALARAQNRYNWDSRIMPSPVNDFIREGFFGPYYHGSIRTSGNLAPRTGYGWMRD